MKNAHEINKSKKSYIFLLLIWNIFSSHQKSIYSCSHRQQISTSGLFVSTHSVFQYFGFNLSNCVLEKVWFTTFIKPTIDSGFVFGFGISVSAVHEISIDWRPQRVNRVQILICDTDWILWYFTWNIVSELITEFWIYQVINYSKAELTKDVSNESIIPFICYCSNGSSHHCPVSAVRFRQPSGKQELVWSGWHLPSLQPNPSLSAVRLLRLFVQGAKRGIIGAGQGW